MILFAPMWAIVLRHLRMWQRDPNYLLSGFYWPLLDVLVWGWLGRWISQSHSSLHNYELTAILGIILWQVVGRGCNVMILTFAEELWSNNLVNLFSLPLAFTQWIGGIVLFCGIMILTTSTFCIGCAYILYDLPVWQLISTFFIFAPPLFFCALWLGFTCLQIIVLLGKRSTELGFVIAWFLLPFCGAYYPIEVLPAWGQTLSTFLPMSYVFQGMRNYVMHNQNPTPYLIKGYTLSIIYALFALLVLLYCFKYSKQKGLARLAD